MSYELFWSHPDGSGDVAVGTFPTLEKAQEAQPAALERLKKEAGQHALDEEDEVKAIEDAAWGIMTGPASEDDEDADDEARRRPQMAWDLEPNGWVRRV